MTSFSIPIIQTSLHHSKSSSAILARSMTGANVYSNNTKEPWLLKGTIRGLGSCSKVLKASTADKTRTCIITKGVDATRLPQLSSGDLTAAQLRLILEDGTHRDVIIGSDSEDLPPQEEIKSLVAYAKDRALELLLGCDADSHHEVWGSTDINPRGESQPSWTEEDKKC